MRIAQIAPLYEAVPPKFYGGTERVVSYLTEALVELGHDVTLFASGDSVTSATLEAAWPRALGIRSPRMFCCSSRCAAWHPISMCCTSISTICRSRCSRTPRRHP